MSCAGGETDQYGRTIGTCSAGGTDLNAWLVANGWALAYLQFSQDYADEEAHARAARLGIHRGRFVDPRDWRRGERLAGTDTSASVTTSDALDAGALADRLLASNDAIVHGPVDGTRDVRDDGRCRWPGRERGRVLRELSPDGPVMERRRDVDR